MSDGMLSIIKSIFPAFLAGVKDLQRSIITPTDFFKDMRLRNFWCAQAGSVGFVMAVALSLLSFPSLKGIGIELSKDFLSVMFVLNCMLLILYGACFWLGARIVLGKGTLFSTINSFFYISIFLVFMKIAEMPALGSRMTALAQSCELGDFGINVTAAISASSVSRTSNTMIGLFYLAFTVCSVKLQRGVNHFGILRGVVSAILGMIFLSVAVVYIQEPAIYAMVCGYVGGK
ncbi:hypothetical protein [Pseudomonas syringae]|uniref:hypothetical protein n=1 Tax=Pseudomonas syringae TaxID=317 RepID=UPI000A86E2EB|nr:hypothetical protein [Pseudomonas syringae]